MPRLFCGGVLFFIIMLAGDISVSAQIKSANDPDSLIQVKQSKNINIYLLAEPWSKFNKKNLHLDAKPTKDTYIIICNWYEINFEKESLKVRADVIGLLPFLYTALLEFEPSEAITILLKMWDTVVVVEHESTSDSDLVYLTVYGRDFSRPGSRYRIIEPRHKIQ